MATVREYMERFAAILEPEEQRSVTPGFLVPKTPSNSVNPTWRLWAMNRDRMTLEKGVRQGYNNSEWVAIAVDRIADAAGSVPWRVSRMVNDEHKAFMDWQMKSMTPIERNAMLVQENFKGWQSRKMGRKSHTLEPLPHHELEHKLESPNKFTDGFNFISRITQHLLLSGNAIVTKTRRNQERGGGILELWNIDPDVVQVNPHPTKIIENYTIQGANGESKNVDPGDLIHLMLPNPKDLFWGRSVLMGIATAIDTDVQAEAWQKQSLENRAEPSSVISLQEEIGDEEQWNMYIEMMKKQHAGARNARTPMVVGNNARVFQTSFSPVEMDFVNSRENYRDIILAGFGVNLVVAGVISDSSQTTLKEARKDFWVNTMIPYLDRLRHAMQLQLASEYGEDIYLWYDLSGIEALRDNFHEKVRSAALLMRHGFTGEAVNRLLQLGFTEQEVAHLKLPLMPASTTYITEDMTSQVVGENNPDSQEEPLEPGDGGDSTNPEDPQGDDAESGAGGNKSWTRDEAIESLETWGVGIKGEYDLPEVCAFLVDETTSHWAEELQLAEEGVALVDDDAGGIWIAFRKEARHAKELVEKR